MSTDLVSPSLLRVPGRDESQGGRDAGRHNFHFRDGHESMGEEGSVDRRSETKGGIVKTGGVTGSVKRHV